MKKRRQLVRHFLFSVLSNMLQLCAFLVLTSTLCYLYITDAKVDMSQVRVFGLLEQNAYLTLVFLFSFT